MHGAEQKTNGDLEEGGLVLPGLWWHQPIDGLGFVEIVAPQLELDDILADSRFAFPAFAGSVLRLWREAGELSSEAWRSNPEMARGFFNMLTLAMALSNKIGQANLEDPYIGAAFRAAFRGRIKLVPDSSGQLKRES